MKIFSVARGKPLDRQTALGLAGMNLLATPGLGTILAGRKLAGLIQLLFATAGFLLIMSWYLALFKSMFGTEPAGAAWLWQLGLTLFAIGWLGSLVSSLDFVRKASAAPVPPKLDGTAD